MKRRKLISAILALTGCGREQAGQDVVVQRGGGQPPGKENPQLPVQPPPRTPKDEVHFSYALEIPDHNGLPITVQDTFRFRSGERFRLQWQANFAAYVYIFNRGPQTNYYTRVFPLPPQASMVGASIQTPARIPKDASDWMRFDNERGDEQMVLVVSRSVVPVLENQPLRYTVDQFDRILIALERSRRPRSLRRFEEGNWHRCIAAGSQPDLAVVSRLPLYHE